MQKKAQYSVKICELFKNDFSVSKLCEYLYNDLEKPAINMFPELREVKNILLNAGCKGVLMSGSGSSVFGIYEEEINLFSKPEWEVFFTKTTKVF